ncbi:MAG TPA: hypothetical protein VJ820_17235 [Propionibacteriaceae bacterium]|nr:hypothetical protein [Propionibacteriaceae bacterium]
MTSGPTGSITGVGRRVEVCAAFEIFFHSSGPMKFAPNSAARRRMASVDIVLMLLSSYRAPGRPWPPRRTSSDRPPLPIELGTKLDPVIGRETEIERVMTVSNERDAC